MADKSDSLSVLKECILPLMTLNVFCVIWHENCQYRIGVSLASCYAVRV